MEKTLKFDYYYGIEAEQFSFYRVPRLLVKDIRFRDLSCEAKLLYGLMLDRLSLSMKNGWLDDENRAYIYYTLENIVEDLGCSTGKCVKVLAELDDKKGIGLIERKKQGLGKPDIIYVKNFDSFEDNRHPEKREENHAATNEGPDLQNMKVKDCKNEKSRLANFESLDLQKMEALTCKSCKSGVTENETLDLQNLEAKYNNNNKTDLSYTNHINQSYQSNDGNGAIDEIDSEKMLSGYIEQIKENIEYDDYMNNNDYNDRELYHELYEIIYEIVCIKHETVRIGGEVYPYELVKARFLSLNSAHLQYVIDSMQNTSVKITNVKAYMITALYNAPSTMKHYYQQEVNHDMYGGGWQEKGIT